MKAATTRTPDWTDCLTGLTGLRLAIYDTLLTTGALYVPQVAAHLNPSQRVLDQIEGALKWLAEHRFVGTKDNCWHAHTPARAREVFESYGPAVIGQPSTYATPARSTGAKDAGDRRNQGAQTAHASGGGVSFSSFTNKPERPEAPERKVHHQSSLLAFDFL
jgi:hypothetical protein